MTAGLTIRRAGLTDVASIWAIEKASFPTPWSRLSFLAELTQRSSHTLVAGPPAPRPWETWGYIIFWIVTDEMHILNLAVHPEHRRRGVGRRMLEEAITQGKNWGARTVWLEVRPSNTPARALYESFAFREVGRRPRYYEDTKEDALLLTLSLPE